MCSLIYEKIIFLSERGYKAELARVTGHPVSNPVVSFAFSVKGGKEVSVPAQIWHFKISAPSHAVEQCFSKFQVSRILYKVSIILQIHSPYLYLPADTFGLTLRLPD